MAPGWRVSCNWVSVVGGIEMNRTLMGGAILLALLNVAICNAQPAPLGAPACQSSTQTAPAGGGGANAPPSTLPAPAAGQLPAGETRIPEPLVWPTPPLGEGPFLIESAEPSHRNLRVVVFSRGLQQPWSLAFLPDGAMLVTERCGQLRIIRNRVLELEPIAGVPEVRAAGLQGLMDVVLHPRFAENHYVYLSYHKPVPAPDTASTVPVATNAGANQPQQPTPQVGGATTLARGVWNGRALTDVRDIFESGATGTEASRIGFGRDGMLYMTISGPGTGPGVARSQDPADYAGKTIRLRDDGTIPPDNPFIDKPGYKPAIYTLGHRNGHSMVLNPETGEMWATEQGPNGGDEINVLKAGANYGWPYVSYGRSYMGPKIEVVREGTVQPTLVWIPSIGVTGMTIYTGDVFTAWQRNAFVGGLRYGEVPNTGRLERIEFNEKWEELRREPLLTDLKQRIRDVRQGPDGLLYVLTAENQGAILRIEPGDPK
jgi:aldose sugar dehydrogenase